MVRAQAQKPTTALEDAYNSLSTKDKQRCKNLITITCGISTTTFYNWLVDQEHISKAHRFYISQVFGIDSEQLFKTKNNGSNM